MLKLNKLKKTKSSHSLSCGNYHTVGVKSDGTCVAVGTNIQGQCNVSSWSDIVQVSCGYEHTVGKLVEWKRGNLMSDG